MLSLRLQGKTWLDQMAELSGVLTVGLCHDDSALGVFGFVIRTFCTDDMETVHQK